MMKPVFVTCVTLAVTGALKVFDLPWVIVPNGAPQGTTHFLGTYMYQKTFVMHDWDYGATLSIVIVVLGVVVSQVIAFITKDRDEGRAK
jgi:raffinose/stachyose/melibiose transport system permease protein